LQQKNVPEPKILMPSAKCTLGMQISAHLRFLIICPLFFDEYIRRTVVTVLPLQAGE